MNGYKIGEVSRVFGIPNDTLRYYESRGLITPQRDEESGYRYYDVWDMNFLLDSLWYRSYGFALGDVVQMIHSDQLDEFEKRYRQREMEILRSIEEQRRILASLSAHRQKLSRIGSELGKFSIENSPEMIWQRQRDKSIMEKGESASHIRRWVELMPHVNHTFVMPETKPTVGEFKDYCWGFSMSPEQIGRYPVEMSVGTEYIPSFKSVRTVFYAGGEGTFMDCFNAQVIEPMKEMGHMPTRPPVGNLLARVHDEKGEMIRYFEVWVPIE